MKRCVLLIIALSFLFLFGMADFACADNYPVNNIGWIKVKYNQTAVHSTIPNSQNALLFRLDTNTVCPFYAKVEDNGYNWYQIYCSSPSNGQFYYGYIRGDMIEECDESGNAIPPNLITGDTWIADGNYANSYAGGTGTKTDPYQISNAAQLARLSKLAHEGTEGSTASNTKYYVLTADISLLDHEWVPIGHDNPFYGSFDGKNYKITGMRLTKPFTYIGLFGNVGFPDSRETLLKNIDVSGSVYLYEQHWTVTNAYVGGIAPQSLTGFENCHADLSVDIKLIPSCGLYDLCISGIGYNTYSADHKILNCSSRGSINVTRSETSQDALSYPIVDVGGISGWASDVCNSFSVMNITVQSGLHTDIGGICSFGGLCTNCYYGGIITADASINTVGNIMGGHGNPDGTADECFVYNCYWNAAFQVPNDANHDGIGQAGDYSINSGTFTGASNEFKVGQTALEGKLNEWASQDKDKYKLWRKSRINDDYKGLLVNGDWDSRLWHPVFDTGDVTWKEIMIGLEKENPWKSLNGATTATKTGNTIVVEGGTIKGNVDIRSKVIWPGHEFPPDYENPSGTYILRNISADGFYIWGADGYSYDIRFEDSVVLGTMYGNDIWLRGKSKLDLTLDTILTCTTMDVPLRIDIESDATLTMKGNGRITASESGWYSNNDQIEYSAFSLVIEGLGDNLNQCIENLVKLYQHLKIDNNLVASTDNKLSVPVFLDLINYRYAYAYQSSLVDIANTEEMLQRKDINKVRMLLPGNTNMSLWGEFEFISNQAALYHIEARRGETTLHRLPGMGTLYFPYPDGTSIATENFEIHHYTGHGIINYSTKDRTIQKTPYGLAINVNELSPFIIEWDKTTAEPTPSATPIPASSASVPTNVPRTGDNANLGLWIILCLMGLIGMIVFSSEMARKHKK